MDIPIGAGHYESDSLPLSAQQAINVYPNVPQTENPLSRASLHSIPGIELLASVANDSANRGAHVMNGIPYFVNGDKLYRLDRALDAASNPVYSSFEVGGVLGTGRVSMADNGTELLIVARNVAAGTSPGTLWDGTDYATISDVDFYSSNGVPTSVVFIDGYFLCTTDTDKFIISSLNAGSTWNALDFGSAEVDPDGITAPFVYLNQLLLFGSETCERFQNIGGSSFPFIRVPGGVFDTGCLAQDGITKGRDGAYFIGSSENEQAAIFRTKGSTAQKVSSTGIEVSLQAFSDTEISNTFAWSYAAKGHYFAGFTIGNTSLVFDEVTGKWHERKSVVSGNQIAWRAATCVPAYGQILVGDSQDGGLSQLNENVYLDRTEPITRLFVAPPFVNDMKPFRLFAVELTVESGAGTNVETDPRVEISLSKDGRTWSDWRDRKIGAIGKYGQRVVWRRLGLIPRFAYARFRCNDNVDFNILKLDIEVV